MNTAIRFVRPWFSALIGEKSAKLFHIDAQILLATIPDSSIDLVITSPPYCIGKEYDNSISPHDFLTEQKRVFPQIERVLKPGGSVCWQVGHHVRNGVAVPLDALVYHAATDVTSLILRNRIVWIFGHGTHSSRRFSGRHETVLWFTKGDGYTFNLDAVRTPQKYPGKRHYKGQKKGEYSGNPLGKNPSDVWDIPNVKAMHVEKTEHPCQFPIALVRRFVKALTNNGDTLLDPYLGSGSSAVAALIEGRHFIGCDVEKRYLEIAKRRLDSLTAGSLPVRPDYPSQEPDRNESVARLPSCWKEIREKSDGTDI